MKTTSWKIFTRFFMPAGLTFAGAACAGLLVLTRDKSERLDAPPRALRVEVTEAELTDTPAVVRASGVVKPARSIGVVAEVGGRITRIHEAMVPGGRVAQGDTLFSIDSREYAVAVDAERAALARAELELSLEKARGEAAKREWAMVKTDEAAPDESLALRKPQLAVAEANLAAALGALERAELRLSRTRVSAPFNAIIIDENVDVGQVVGPGAPVATLFGTDSLRVEVSVPLEQLRYVQIPGVQIPGVQTPSADAGTESYPGSKATITQRLGTSEPIVRDGRIVGLAGRLDPQSRTATVLVEVDATATEGLPLLPGAFVDVQLFGGPLEGAIALSEDVVHEGSSTQADDKSAADGMVWLASSEDLLTRRAVKVGWRANGKAWITGGLEPGERVVTSALPLPVEGMPLLIGPGDGAAPGATP